MIKLTDSHCHISLNDNIDEIEKNALNSGIYRFINNGCNIENNNEVLEISKKYPNIYSAIGIHPEDIKLTLEEYKEYFSNIDPAKIIAIGEIGLDFLNGITNIELQKSVFRLQLEFASKNNLPVIIHSRNALEETIMIIKEYNNLKGVLHSFDGTLEQANELIKLGFKLGFNGIITFKNFKKQDLIKQLPLESILLETDSPYLAPEPKRGTKNEPANTFIVAQKICQLKNITLEKLQIATEKSINDIFDI